MSLPDTVAPDFSQPLDLLHACHGRIEKQCATLLKLAEHLARQGCDDQAQQAAQAVLKYFSTAAIHHHEDEEVDLFPLLRAAMDDETGHRVRAVLANLVAQHRDMEAALEAIMPWLQSTARGMHIAPDYAALGKLIDLYRQHIALEERELFPHCRQLLTPTQLKMLGCGMAARRGVTWSAG